MSAPEVMIRAVACAVAEHVNLSEEALMSAFETPPDAALGDLALPCFRLAKAMRQAPSQIADTLKRALDGQVPAVARFEVKGGYLNMFFDRAQSAKTIINQTLDAGDRVGWRDDGHGKTVLVEYSAPNIAKAFHIGHGFSTILGQALANLYGHRGYRVVRINYLGDYGTQFGKLIVAWQRWGNDEALSEHPFDELQRIYVKFHQMAETEPTLIDEGRAAFARLEQGDPEALALWQRFRDLSLEVFNRTYARLGIVYDDMHGERFYSDKIPAVMDWLRSLNLLTKSDGALVVDLSSHNLAPCLLIKSDGSTIYASRELASILWRDKTYDFDRCIYVVGQEQKHHFKQVIAVMQEAHYPKWDRLIHVAFGRVLFGDQAFSTRKGNFIRLETLLDESVAKTRALIEANSPTMAPDEMAKTAEAVGLSAVVYTFLRNSREKDIRFSWEETLDFDGDSAPYLLYTVARCQSLLGKANRGPSALSDADAERLTDDEASAVLTLISGFEGAIDAALVQHEPSILLRHITMLARAFNRFYQHHSILHADDEVTVGARVLLTRAVLITLVQGVTLLGMKPVTRM